MKRCDARTVSTVSALAMVLACGDVEAEQGGSTGTDLPTGSEDSGTAPHASRTTGRTSDGAMDGGSDGDDCEPASSRVVSETTTFFTVDDKEIAGTVFRPDEGTCLPAVLLVHQYMRDRWQWGTLPDRLAQRGHLVLAIDLRGHGDSDEQDGYLPELLTDPDQAPLDVHAALEWLQGRGEVDPVRIGIVGTSIGAYLAGVAVVLHWGVETIVAISPLTDAIRGLARHDETIVLRDVYCVAAEHDSEGAQARSCEQLVEMATGEARIDIFEDSADHGVEILERQPELVTSIVDWIDRAL